MTILCLFKTKSFLQVFVFSVNIQGEPPLPVEALVPLLLHLHSLASAARLPASRAAAAFILEKFGLRIAVTFCDCNSACAVQSHFVTVILPARCSHNSPVQNKSHSFTQEEYLTMSPQQHSKFRIFQRKLHRK